MPPKKVTPGVKSSGTTLAKSSSKTAAAKTTPAKPSPTTAAKPTPTTAKSTAAVPKGKAPVAGGAKKSSSNTKAGQGKNDQPKQIVWTPQDDAARKIQTKYRQYLSKKELEKKKKEKEEYEALMDKLEKEAFIQLVKMEQEAAEKKQQKEDEERRRKVAETKRRKRMLEAAFDGEVAVMEDIIKEVSDLDTKNGIGHDVIGRSLRTKHMMAVVDCEDPNGNTPLSEAANGGEANAISFLLERGAHPNSQGQFMRTPLYRAAFAGNLEAVQVLLENGADPRIYAQDGQTPKQIASTAHVQEILENWDVAQTEILQKKIEAAKEKRAEEDRLRREAETSKLEDVVAEAQKEYETKQKQLNHAYCELNKRITEHDTCVGEGFARTDITLQSIHDHEFEVESIKIDVTKARDALAKAKLQLRESINGEEDGTGDDGPGLKILIKDLDEVLFRDVGNRIKDSGKWPLLIDTSGQASTFLRYRDTNFVNALRPSDMEDNNVRRAIIGAIRYGKPFVLDMMEVDMYETCIDRFDVIMPGLMASLLDKSILQEEKYLKLAKKEDGLEYEKTKFNDLRLSQFKFVIITKNPYLNEKLLDLMYIIKVSIPT